MSLKKYKYKYSSGLQNLAALFNETQTSSLRFNNGFVDIENIVIESSFVTNIEIIGSTEEEVASFLESNITSIEGN